MKLPWVSRWWHERVVAYRQEEIAARSRLVDRRERERDEARHERNEAERRAAKLEEAIRRHRDSMPNPRVGDGYLWSILDHHDRKEARDTLRSHGLDADKLLPEDER